MMLADEAKERELEEYAQAYFKYIKFFQDQGALTHKKVNAAHAWIATECIAVQDGTLFIVWRRPNDGGNTQGSATSGVCISTYKN